MRAGARRDPESKRRDSAEQRRFVVVVFGAGDAGARHARPERRDSRTHTGRVRPGGGQEGEKVVDRAGTKLIQILVVLYT